MRNFFVIWKRELTACFLSPVAYVTMVIYLAVSGLIFLRGIQEAEGHSDPPELLLFVSLIFWIPVLVTVISMRLFAEEKRTGTIETLVTAPVSETEIVLGKYAGAVTFLLLVVVPSLSPVYVLKAISPGLDHIDAGSMAGGCIILLLMSLFSMSMGVVASMLTRNQIIAAICCFVAAYMPVLFKFLAPVVTVFVGTGSITDYLSLESHVVEFARGTIDTRPVVFYISSTVFVLFAAVRILEARRWWR